MKKARQPPALREGDCVAVVSPSWGGPHVFPRVFEAGLRTLRETLGLEVREYPSTRASPEALFADAAGRARDLTAAFEDPDVKAIVASIGGEDSLRILPHLDPDRLARHPKVFMGFSDATTLLLALRQAGLVTFHGPTVMAGLAQAPSFPEQFVAHLRAVLFEGRAVTYRPYPWYVQSYPEWSESPSHATAVGTKYIDRAGFRVVQGSGCITAEALGGCFDVMAFMLGTPYFPEPSDFEDKLLLLETSEEKPSPERVRRVLWNLQVSGVIERLAGVLLGRCRDYRPDESARLEGYLVDVARDCGRPELPIVTNLDLGHTDPKWVIPLGVPLELDANARTLRSSAPAVQTSRSE